ncbi:MAG: hypothetical protein HYV07_34005 [Deltaproteobacteria bacterium]|nr:hypothetical protein [Deltaproteobacteria bacterium]
MPTEKLTRYELDELLREGRSHVREFLRGNPPDPEAVITWSRAVRAGILKEPEVDEELRRKIEEQTRLLIAPDLGRPASGTPAHHVERINRLLDFARHNTELAPTKLSHAAFAQFIALLKARGSRVVRLSDLDGQGLDPRDVRRACARAIDVGLAKAVADDPEQLELNRAAVAAWPVE